MKSRSRSEHPGPPPDLFGGAVLGGAIGALTAVATAAAASVLALPWAWGAAQRAKAGIAALLDSPFLAAKMNTWSPADVAGALVQSDQIWRLTTVTTAPLVAAAAAGLWTFYWFAFRDRRAIEHVAGRELISSPRAAARAASADMKDDRARAGAGIEIAPGVPVSLDRETRHFLICGSTGAGKTVVIRHVLDQIAARGDRAIIFDSKTDFTQLLDAAEFRPALIAPWDSRSSAWSVSEDIINKSDARELAARLIPESSDPMWSSAARQILTAIIVKLQRSKPREWIFADVADEFKNGTEHIADLLAEHAPEVASLLADPESKTSASIITTLLAQLSPVFDLADAWPADKKRLSLRRWLLRDEAAAARGARTIVLQGSGRYQTLTRAYIQSLIAAITSIVTSPDCPDSKSRRVWLILDEVPQLGRIDELSRLLEVGRSKGIRVVLGLQDVAQIRELYSREIADSWASMVGTMLVCRTQGAETPRWLAETIGEQQIRRYQPSAQTTPGPTAAANQVTETWQTVDEPVIRAEQFATEIGADKRGVTAYLHTYSDRVYRLRWPYPTTKKHRPATVAAAWTRPGYPHCADEIAAAVADELPPGDTPPADQAGQTDDELRKRKTRQIAAQVVGTESTVTVAEPPAAPAGAPAPSPAARDSEHDRDADSHDDEFVKRAAEEVAESALETLAPGLTGLLHTIEVASETAEIVETAAPDEQPQQQTQRKKRRFKRRVVENEQEV